MGFEPVLKPWRGLVLTADTTVTWSLDLGVVASHQLMDTPAVTAALTQYDEHAVQCRCGQVHAAAAPAGPASPAP